MYVKKEDVNYTLRTTPSPTYSRLGAPTLDLNCSEFKRRISSWKALGHFALARLSPLLPPLSVRFD